VIRVTLLNNAEMIINAELIETVESSNDTILTLSTGRKIVVKETAGEIAQRVMEYQAAVHRETCRTT